MRIMIAASGGLDSTALLYETLRDTTHDIVAAHITGVERETDAFIATTNWLKREVRGFETDIAAPTPMPADPEHEWPIRPGFHNRQVSRGYRQRYESTAASAERLNVAQCWSALTLWNRRHGANVHKTLDDIWRAHTTVPRITPWITRDTDAGVWRGRSRLRNYNAIPETLRALIASCIAPKPYIGCTCKMCVARRFWDVVCEPNIAHLDAIELRCEKLGCFGRHERDADPKTYKLYALWDAIEDLNDWNTWLASLTP